MGYVMSTKYVKVSFVVDTWTGRVWGYETRNLRSPRYVRLYILPRLKEVIGLEFSPRLIKEILDKQPRLVSDGTR